MVDGAEEGQELRRLSALIRLALPNRAPAVELIIGRPQ